MLRLHSSSLANGTMSGMSAYDLPYAVSNIHVSSVSSHKTLLIAIRVETVQQEPLLTKLDIP